MGFMLARLTAARPAAGQLTYHGASCWKPLNTCDSTRSERAGAGFRADRTGLPRAPRERTVVFVLREVSPRYKQQTVVCKVSLRRIRRVTRAASASPHSGLAAEPLHCLLCRCPHPSNAGAFAPFRARPRRWPVPFSDGSIARLGGCASPGLRVKVHNGGQQPCSRHQWRRPSQLWSGCFRLRATRTGDRRYVSLRARADAAPELLSHRGRPGAARSRGPPDVGRGHYQPAGHRSPSAARVIWPAADHRSIFLT
jgi:hypothetical protein